MSRRKRNGGAKEQRIISEELLPQLKLEMLNNNELIIDGCKGILDYGEDFIKLNTGQVVTMIKGTELLIESFDREMAIIKGVICDISFVS